ncbi:MAG: helix-turn-helix transcriptional regulator [Lachnospiraceae bacterium]|nr:helix-turn-helix transcriptional regulator [Lachnospiraceae bacterium]
MEDFTTNNVLSRIEELLKTRHWTHYRLSKESGIPYSSISNMFKRNTVPSIPTLMKICDGLKISMSDFFRYEEKTFSETITLAKNIEELDEYKKNLLMTYINCLKQSDK